MRASHGYLGAHDVLERRELELVEPLHFIGYPARADCAQAMNKLRQRKARAEETELHLRVFELAERGQGLLNVVDSFVQVNLNKLCCADWSAKDY